MSSTESNLQNPDTPPAKLRTLSLSLLVVASMIGSGVFTTSGFTLGAVGSPLRVLLCWALAGLIALCGAVAYGQLARILPENGGEFLHLSRSAHPFAGFLAGWVSLTAGFSGAIAYAAVTFEAYAIPEQIRPVWLPADAVAISVVILCAFAHGFHVTLGARLQNVIVAIKLAALGTFLAVVFWKLPDHVWHFAALETSPSPGLPLLNAIVTSLVWISLSYAGFNAAIYVAGEAAEARNDVPKALIRGTVAVTLLYMVLNAIFVTSAPAEQLQWKQDIAAIAGEAVGGAGLAFVIRVGICLGLVTSVAGMTQAGPRVYSQMADDRVFPELFRSLNGGVRRAILLQAAIAIGLILVQRLAVTAGLLENSLLGLLIYLSTTLSISSACCVMTLFLPSVRRRHTPSLGVDVAAAVYVICTLSAVILLVLTHSDGDEWVGPRHLIGAVATFVTGAIAWRFLRHADSDHDDSPTEKQAVR